MELEILCFRDRFDILLEKMPSPDASGYLSRDIRLFIGNPGYDSFPIKKKGLYSYRTFCLWIFPFKESA